MEKPHWLQSGVCNSIQFPQYCAAIFLSNLITTVVNVLLQSRMIYAHSLLHKHPLSLPFILRPTSCPLSSSLLGEALEFPHDNRNLYHMAYIRCIRCISLKGMKAL